MQLVDFATGDVDVRHPLRQRTISRPGRGEAARRDRRAGVQPAAAQGRQGLRHPDRLRHPHAAARRQPGRRRKLPDLGDVAARRRGSATSTIAAGRASTSRAWCSRPRCWDAAWRSRNWPSPPPTSRTAPSSSRSSSLSGGVRSLSGVPGGQGPHAQGGAFRQLAEARGRGIVLTDPRPTAGKTSRCRLVTRYKKGPAVAGGAELSGRMMKRKKQLDETPAGSAGKERNIARTSEINDEPGEPIVSLENFGQ